MQRSSSNTRSPFMTLVFLSLYPYKWRYERMKNTYIYQEVGIYMYHYYHILKQARIQVSMTRSGWGKNVNVNS